jgi:superfamily I DNA and/or RNA helicase
MRTGVKPKEIGIITPYEGQRAHVLSVMQRSGSLASNLYAEVSQEGALPCCKILQSALTLPEP